MAGKVWFIGAGPGDPELITVKGQRLLSEADLVVYAGSLVPPVLLRGVRPGVPVVDSAPLNLRETHALLRGCTQNGGMAARLHTGDPALYGAIREQMELLRADGIEYGVVPGVSAAFAAAAAANASFTVPGVVQSLSITRLAGRTPVPEGQSVRELAAHKGAMAIYLSADLSASKNGGLAEQLRAAGLGPQTTIIAAYRVGWPEERLARCTLENLENMLAEEAFDKQTVFLVLPGENAEDARSLLYDAEFTHKFR